MKKFLYLFIFLFSAFSNAELVKVPDYVFIDLGHKQEGEEPYDYTICGLSVLGGTNCKIKDDSTFSLGIGYNFIDNVDFELRYSELGSSRSYMSVVTGIYCSPGCPQEEGPGFHYKYSSLSVNTSHKIKFKEKIFGFGKLGISYFDIEKKGIGSFENFQNFPGYEDSKFELIYGLGVLYDFSGPHDLYIEFTDSGYSNLESFFSFGYKYNISR